MDSAFRRLVLIVSMLGLCAVTRSACGAAQPTYRDLKYSSHWTQGLDIYLPAHAPDEVPVVVFIHGGGWLEGDKSEAGQYVDALLARGMAVVAINYRFSQHARFPAQLHDCKGAIRWIRAHASEYGLDASRIAVFGESAGAHLAALLATTGDEAGMEGNVGGNLNQSSIVQALVDAFGPTDLFTQALTSAQAAHEISALIGHDINDVIEHRTDPNYASWVALVNSANPIRHADSESPPAYLFHGLADPYVPPTESQALAEEFQQDHVATMLRLAPGVGHELPGPERPAVWGFLQQQLGHDADPQLLSPLAGGAHADDEFGAAIAFIGDIDHDGVDDVAVGAPNQAHRGHVTVYSGSSGHAMHVLVGKPGDRFGSAIAALGDINGDGNGDLAIGAPGSDHDSGGVEVWAGGTWQLIRTHKGEHAGDELGSALAAANVHGDGRRDILCGAPRSDNPGSDTGSILIFDGGDGHLLSRIRGRSAGERFGAAIANARDCDGDGRDDFIVGAPSAPHSNAADSGYVALYRFAGERPTLVFRRYGSAGDALGASVAGIGDADGDGRNDVAAGAPHARIDGWADAGRILVLAGADGRVIAEHSDHHPQAGERFGCAVAPAGDIDGDGLDDIAIGADGCDRGGSDRGRIWLMRGIEGGGQVIGRIDGQAAGARFGQALAGSDHQSRLAASAGGMIWNGSRRGVVYRINLEQVD